MTSMHPDSAATYSPTWSPDAPTVRRDGSVTVVVRSRRTTTTATTDHHQADMIARRLVHGARLVTSRRTVDGWGCDGPAIREYRGTALTDLAVRRG